MGNNKYILFKLKEKKPKTAVYSVVNVSSSNEIGEIKWYPAWRQYCFFPDYETIWNDACLKEIILFIRKLMNARK